MRFLFFLLLTSVLIIPSAPRAQETEPQNLPNVTLLDLEGNETSLADLEGQVLVVNFWATWCAPCRHEMPSLSRLQAKFDEQPVRVVAVSVDRGSVPNEKLTAFMDEVEVDNLLVLRTADFSVMQDFEIPGLPATLLVGKDGLEYGRVLGVAEWDSAKSVEAVEFLLNETPSPS